MARDWLQQPNKKENWAFHPALSQPKNGALWLLVGTVWTLCFTSSIEAH